MRALQIQTLHAGIDALQTKHGSSRFRAIYGAGCVEKPKIMFVFMNPTGRNVSAQASWNGLRAPWLGTKNVWKILRTLGLLPNNVYELTQKLPALAWTPKFALELYEILARQKVYITNLAKCTQDDARHLPDSVFREYGLLMEKEIFAVKPRSIITFGNQVSSVLLGRSVSVSMYTGVAKEDLHIGRVTFAVYPVYYPVGQGQRNMPLAIKRLQSIIQAT